MLTVIVHLEREGKLDKNPSKLYNYLNYLKFHARMNYFNNYISEVILNKDICIKFFKKLMSKKKKLAIERIWRTEFSKVQEHSV